MSHKASVLREEQERNKRVPKTNQGFQDTSKSRAQVEKDFRDRQLAKKKTKKEKDDLKRRFQMADEDFKDPELKARRDREFEEEIRNRKAQEGDPIRLGGGGESPPIRLGGEAEEKKSLFGQAQEQFERVQAGESFLGDFWGAKLLADPRTSIVLINILSLLSIKKMISGTTLAGRGGATGAAKAAADKAAALVKTPNSKLAKPLSDVFRLGSKQGSKVTSAFPEFVLPKGANIKHLKPFTQNLSKATKALKTLTPSGLRELWKNPYVSFIGKAAGVNVIIAWLASDNIVDGMNIHLNGVARQVENGTMTKEEAGAVIAQLAEWMASAGNFANISASINPLLIPFKNVININVQGNELEFQNIITRIEGAETPEEREARKEEEQLEFEGRSLDLAEEKTRLFEESQARQNEAELELAKEKNRLFALSQDEQRQKELAQQIEDTEYFKSISKGKTTTQKSSLSFGLLNTILTLLIDTEGGE
jgi:hypothetical protein